VCSVCEVCVQRVRAARARARMCVFACVLVCARVHVRGQRVCARLCAHLWLRQSTEYDTYLNPVGYTKYSRSNAYTGNGADDIDTDASAPTGLTPAQCTQRCAYEATTSSTYTRARTHTHTQTHTLTHTHSHTLTLAAAPLPYPREYSGTGATTTRGAAASPSAHPTARARSARRACRLSSRRARTRRAMSCG
jgi:hypothetical protein